MDLAHLQQLMEELYGSADRERGIPATVAWLAEELGELAQAVRKGSREQQVHEQRRRAGVNSSPRPDIRILTRITPSLFLG